MLHLIIILQTYRSVIINHIFHKIGITGHLFKSFYQRDIDGKLFQHSNKTPVFTILDLFYQSLQEWWWWSWNGGHLLVYRGFFSQFFNHLTTNFHYLIISSFLIFYARWYRWINSFLILLSSDFHAMSIILRILNGISRKTARLLWLHSSGKLGHL